MKHTEFLILLFCWSFVLSVFVYLSLLFWIKRFIIKRYEKETDLLKTIWFQNHATFVPHMPPFFSTTFYSGHVLMCLWAWKRLSKNKMFEDITSPEQVSRHFSKGELIRIKLWGIAGILTLVQGGIGFVLMKLGY